MTLLSPDILKGLIQHDKAITFAVAMLNQHWSDIIAKYGPQTKIEASTVRLAKRLSHSGWFRSSLDFDNYASVRQYLIHNDIYTGSSGQQELLKPFKE